MNRFVFSDVEPGGNVRSGLKGERTKGWEPEGLF